MAGPCLPRSSSHWEPLAVQLLGVTGLGIRGLGAHPVNRGLCVASQPLNWAPEAAWPCGVELWWAEWEDSLGQRWWTPRWVLVSLQSYTRSAAFIVTLHPLQSTIPDFWRLVYDYGCTSIVMLNQLHQSNSAWVRAVLGGQAGCLLPRTSYVQGHTSKASVGSQLCHLLAG